jgi:hypothetical protein
METPHARYKHLWALLRMTSQLIATTGKLSSRGAAEAELQRLTSINSASNASMRFKQLGRNPVNDSPATHHENGPCDGFLYSSRRVSEVFFCVAALEVERLK